MKQSLNICKDINENGREWSQVCTEREKSETQLQHSREQLLSQGLIQDEPSLQQSFSRHAMQEH